MFLNVSSHLWHFGHSGKSVAVFFFYFNNLLDSNAQRVTGCCVTSRSDEELCDRTISFLSMEGSWNGSENQEFFCYFITEGAK